MPEGGPRRHDRVWLGRRWTAPPGVLAPPLQAAAEAWSAAGRPFVATRSDPLRPGAVALGLALAPGAPVRRIALAVEPAAVVRVAPPLALRDVLPSAPAPWRAPLAALDRAARVAGVALRVHGSLAWQHLSGVAHVTPSSDVDLLARPRDAAALARLLALLGEAETRGGPRLDGEVILPGGRGVAWRELRAGSARLLVKGEDGALLLPRADALGALAGAAEGAAGPGCGP